MSLSTDGRRWSPLEPLMSCSAIGQRATAHPVSGGAILGPRPPAAELGKRRVRAPSDTRQVHFFMQLSVPSISFDAFAPMVLYTWLRARDERKPSSHLERYSLPCSLLAQWTAAWLEGGWQGQQPTQQPLQNAEFAPGCAPPPRANWSTVRFR